MARLDRALSENVLLGVQSNIGFLRELLSMEEVETGAIDTELVERGFENVTVQPPSVDVYAVLALSRLLRLWPAAAVSNRWDIPDGWRTGGERGEMSWEFEDTAKHSVVLGISGDPDAAHVRIGDEPPFAASASLCGHELEGSVGHRRLKAVVCDDDRDIWVWVDGRHHKFREVVRESESRGATGGADTDVLRSPMPGTVIAVRVQPDDEVPRGEVLVIVEAMKMEYALKAAAAGRVDEIYVNVGDKVAADDPLARLTALVEAQ
jgi:acetyl-CoA/propionyl-CoA carboxylase biotin carboxyl carrier protein